MKTRITLAAAMFACVPIAGAQDSFLIDFGVNETPTLQGPAPDDPTNVWNNVGTDIGAQDTGVLPDLSTIDGTLVSGMNLEMIRSFNGANQVGNAASAAYPENAARDSLYGNTENFGGRSDVFPAFRLAGLDPALSYSLTFYASRMGVGDNRETEYTVSGANSTVVYLNPSNNDLDTTVSAEDILPDATGAITVEVAPGPNNDNGNHFTYLGALRIDTAPNTGDLEITSQPASLTVDEFELATFAVSITGTGPFDVQWSRDGTEIPGADNFTYTIPEATLDLSGSVFTVTVENGDGVITSDGATLTVTPDTAAPAPLSASTSDGVNIRVTFDEILAAGPAADPASYTVASEGGAVAVVSVSVDPAGDAVTLTLASAVAGEFTVGLPGVTDRAGNAAEPAQISGSAPVAGTTIYLFDFGGGAPTDPINAWNHIPDAIGQDDLGALAGVVDTFGNVGGLGLQMIARFNGTNTNGDAASALYPAGATGDSLYGNVEEWGSLTDILPAFKLTGLDPASEYSLTFYAARLGVGDNRETQYTITDAAGDTVLLFDPANNDSDRTASAGGLLADANNEISVALAPGPANTNGNHFIYLNVLEVAATPASRKPFAITDIAVGPAAGELTLTFDGLPGQTYILYGSDDLEEWEEVDDSIPSSGEGSTYNFTDPAAGPLRLYRLEAE